MYVWYGKMDNIFWHIQCIDQTNLEEKHSQISNMDRIYSKASLVIIAAAEEDPHYGLQA